MKLKPIVKVNESKSHLASWVIEKFPTNYKDLNYIEPFIGDGSVMLNKEPSLQEIGNNENESIIKIWQSLRDEHKLFISKLKKLDCKQKTFDKYKNKKETDYLNAAIVEFVLRQLSKSGMKKNYMQRKKTKEHCWQNFFDNANLINDRLKNIFFLNKNPVDVIRAFGGANSLIYCDIPNMQNGEESKHIELNEAIIASRGKVIITAQNNTMYRKLYANWNKKNIPNKPKEAAWLNF